jgi:ribonuclease P protein component
VPGSHAFPPSARITRAAEYKFVFERGERAVGRHFVCHVARQEGGEGCRLGLAVSRKVGHAVARNRVKRRIREFFRTRRDEFDPDVLLVVVARPGAADLDWSGLSGELERLLRRGGVIRGKADDCVH